jgi:hypothetical protein
VRDGPRHSFRCLLLRDADALLAHGEPLPHDGDAALRRFLERPVGEPGYGDTLSGVRA